MKMSLHDITKETLPNRRIADMQNFVVETKIASVTECLLLMMILVMITRKKINGSKSNRSNG